MWFGILTPGAHPSLPTPTDEGTVFAWTPAGRHRIAGPYDLIHGGVRTVRRSFFEQELTACPPRCFTCLRPAPVPSPRGIAPTDVSFFATAIETFERFGPRPEGQAGLVWLHVAPLAGPEDTPLDEDALLVLPGRDVAFVVPLDRVWELAWLLAPGADDMPRCTRCRAVLPGSVEQRDASERRDEVRARRTRSSSVRRRAA